MQYEQRNVDHYSLRRVFEAFPHVRGNNGDNRVRREFCCHYLKGNLFSTLLYAQLVRKIDKILPKALRTRMIMLRLRSDQLTESGRILRVNVDPRGSRRARSFVSRLTSAERGTHGEGPRGKETSGFTKL